MTTPASPDTIHAIISPTLKQSIREFCAKHDCRESQLVRRAEAPPLHHLPKACFCARANENLVACSRACGSVMMMFRISLSP